ncbi:hypothetical protein BIU97_04780 [Curtobacterium sp. MCBA15_009]|nr:hypothetical protein BIU97_04780 [Curtobacterium sp. MCBA15_009]
MVDIRQIPTDRFVYPDRFTDVVVEVDLPAIRPWSWLCEYEGDSSFWAATVAEQYPGRSLVPFAKHQDTDDVFCFEGTDHTGDPPVLVIHAFASPGTEYRGQWTSFDVWWEEMEEHRAAWLAEQEHEHEHEDEDEDPR